MNGISSCSLCVGIPDRLLVDEQELSGPPRLLKLLVVEKQSRSALVSLLVNNKLQVSRLRLLSPHFLKVEIHAWTTVSSSPRHHHFQFFLFFSFFSLFLLVSAIKAILGQGLYLTCPAPGRAPPGSG